MEMGGPGNWYRVDRKSTVEKSVRLGESGSAIPDSRRDGGHVFWELCGRLSIVVRVSRGIGRTSNRYA